MLTGLMRSRTFAFDMCSFVNEEKSITANFYIAQQYPTNCNNSYDQCISLCWLGDKYWEAHQSKEIKEQKMAI